MTDRPIPFSGAMVRALLQGRKTQTRRVLKPSRIDDHHQRTYWPCYEYGRRVADMCHPPRIFAPGPGEKGKPFSPVRIDIGDRLWVREAWRTTDSLDHMSPTEIAAACLNAGYRGPWCPYVTEADGEAHNWNDEDRGVPMFGAFSDDAGRLRASMHMPRWASRITLIVTEVRVQRLQEISEADARAEGMPIDHAGEYYAPPPPDVDSWQGYGRASFSLLWNELNADRGFGWEVNPWVTATTFTVHKSNIDAMERGAAA